MTARAGETPLDACEQEALRLLRQRARREADCATCRGYGWYPLPGLPQAGDTHAAQVRVCGCAAGRRFWTLALDDTDGLLALMDLDANGSIASADGMYGRFGVTIA